eukprot:PLAT10745.1.p1 GENE.PLAT10745.1~~PLAT10745.1.p1  ORF type:complete len:358 (+),score=63.73 PLAT10745.1:110-1075(+)
MDEFKKDPYRVLGVPRKASTQQIKHAYRKLARKWHPDRNSGKEAERKIIDLNRAYDVLKDPTRRRNYDLASSPGQRGARHYGPRNYRYSQYAWQQAYAEQAANTERMAWQVTPLLILAVAALFWLRNRGEDGENHHHRRRRQEQQQQQQQRGSSPPPAAPTPATPSPLTELARAHAPALVPLTKSLWEMQGRRRMIVLFILTPSAAEHADSLPWAAMAQTARRFKTDPLRFAYLDADCRDGYHEWLQWMQAALPATQRDRRPAAAVLLLSRKLDKAMLFAGPAGDSTGVAAWLERVLGGQRADMKPLPASSEAPALPARLC